MGTMYDALKRAEGESNRHRPLTLHKPVEEEVRPGRDAAAPAEFVIDHGDIKNNLLSLGADGSTKRLLLINTFEGGESPDCVLRFAASLTEDSDLGVLVVDLNPWVLSLGKVLTTDHTLGLLDLFPQGDHTPPPIEKVGPGDLYTARLGGDHARFSELLESGSFDRFLDSTNERFDFVILDMPGGAGFQECRAVCAKVDAAALILQPGASADQIALSAKKYIENPADKLLGIIVDKAKPSRRIRLEVVSTVIATCLAFCLGFLVGDLRTGPGDAPPTRLESAAVAEVRIDPPRPEKIIPVPPPVPPARVEATLASAQEAPAATAAKPGSSVEVPPSVEIRVKEALVEKASVIDTPVEETPAKEALVAKATQGRTEAGQVRTVVVAEGDNLYRIIIGAYGAYDEELLRHVLNENPEIPSSKKILVGRTLRLPRVD
jgi:Mrp family chromosome partitioning ATPase